MAFLVTADEWDYPPKVTPVYVLAKEVPMDLRDYRKDIKNVSIFYEILDLSGWNSSGILM